MHRDSKRDSEEQLPKFRAETLGAEELCQVTGGMPPQTAGTRSVCDEDGTYDGDGSDPVA